MVTNYSQKQPKVSQKLQKNTCVGVSFLIKLQALGLQLIKKDNLTHVFFSEFCEIFKNTFFTEHLRVAVSIQWNTGLKWVNNDIIRLHPRVWFLLKHTFHCFIELFCGHWTRAEFNNMFKYLLLLLCFQAPLLYLLNRV